MTRKRLKIMMLEQNVSVQKVAHELRVSPVSVYDVMKGVRTSHRIQEALSSHIGIPFEAIQEAWNNEDETSEPAPEIIAMQNRIRQQHGLNPVPA